MSKASVARGKKWICPKCHATYTNPLGMSSPPSCKKSHSELTMKEVVE